MKTIAFIFAVFVFCAASVSAQTPSPTPTKIPASSEPIKVTDANLRETEAALRKNPKDVDRRKALITYYEGKSEEKKDAASAKSLQQQRLAFVQNTPDSWYFSELGYWYEGDEKKTEYLELRNEWLKQVNLHKNDVGIRSNAVRFIAELEPDAAEKILREGMVTNPESDEFPEKLIDLLSDRIDSLNVAYDNRQNNVTLADIDAAAKKFIAEIEKRLEAYQSEDYKKFSNDRLVLLVKFGKAALEINDLKNAKQAAEAIAADFNEEGGIYESEGIFYSNMLLGRIALREGNLAKAKEHLLKAAALPEAGEWKFPDNELDLPAELLAKGEKQAVLEYVKLAQKKAEEEDALITLRQWERRLSRNLSPLTAGKKN